jgi:hypothetical protein
VYDASGHDLIRTQRIVGHSSPEITSHYLESTQSELDELVMGLGAPTAAASPVLAFSACPPPGGPVRRLSITLPLFCCTQT